MPDENLKIHVHLHLGYEWDIARFKERYDRGESTEYTPYELHLVQRPGVTVAFSSNQGHRPPGRLARIINRRLHFAIDYAWRNRRALAASDAVWTMSESEAFAVAALMWLRVIPRRPIIGTAIWLFHNWPTLPPLTRSLFRLLSRYIDVLTVHSNLCLDAAATSGLRTSVELSPFGVSGTSFQPLPPRAAAQDEPIRVLAAGNDWTRDWQTLLAAFGGDDRFVLSAWTMALDEGDLARVDNLRLPKPSSLAAIRQMYAEADVVVVPMVDNLYSGITVALEAVAQERTVVSTATGGVPTYFAEGEVRYVPPGDAEALRDAALAAREPGVAAMIQRARARFMAGDYTTRGMIDRYLALTRRSLIARTRT